MSTFYQVQFFKRKEKFGLTNDFYITRLFAPDKRQWIDVVLMQEKLFVLINGDTVECELKKCYQVLPSPARVRLFQCEFTNDEASYGFDSASISRMETKS